MQLNATALPRCLSSAAHPQHKKSLFWGVQSIPWRSSLSSPQSTAYCHLSGHSRRGALIRRAMRAELRYWGRSGAPRWCREAPEPFIHNKQGTWQLPNLLLSARVNCYWCLFIEIITDTSKAPLHTVAHPFWFINSSCLAKQRLQIFPIVCGQNPIKPAEWVVLDILHKLVPK